MVGATASFDFPARGFGMSLSGGIDGFVTKLSADGSSMVYSVYLGGKGSDVLEGVAVNSLGEANVVGWTSSSDTFPPRLTGRAGQPCRVRSTGSWRKSMPMDLFWNISHITAGRRRITRLSSSPTPATCLRFISAAWRRRRIFRPRPERLCPWARARLYLSSKPSLLSPNAEGDEASAPRTCVRSNRRLFPWFTPAPDGCKRRGLGLRFSDSLKRDQRDLTEIEEAALVSGVSFVNGPAGTALGGLIVIKHIMEPCSGSGKAKSGPIDLAEHATQASGPLFGVSTFDGAVRSSFKEPPLSATGSISPKALATDSSGNIYVAVQTSDSTLPVSGSGLGAGSGAASGTGYISKLGSGQAGAPTITKVANAEGGESTTIAPNTWVEIKGSGFGSTARIWQNSDFVGG